MNQRRQLRDNRKLSDVYTHFRKLLVEKYWLLILDGRGGVRAGRSAHGTPKAALVITIQRLFPCPKARWEDAG
jgi:hypothetical protein